MRRNKRKNIAVLFLAFIFIAGCGKKEMNKEIIRRVKIMKIAKSDISRKITFSGVVTPEKESVLGFKVAGNVLKIYAEKGGHVKAGDILAQMDPKDYKTALDAATENYKAKSAVAENATLQFKRVEKLYKEKAATKKVFDETKAFYIGSLSAKKAAQKEMENAMNMVQYTTLKAPYDGYITGKSADEGTVLGAGIPVFTIISDKESEVKIGVSEKEISTLKDASEIIFEHDDKSYPLKIKEISKKPDASKLSYEVSLRFLTSFNLMSGTHGKVIVEIKNETNEIKIPLKAIFEDSGTKVWLYKDGVVEPQEVVLGRLDSDGEVVILSGLNSEDKVITAGVNFLHKGERVKL